MSEGSGAGGERPLGVRILIEFAKLIGLIAILYTVHLMDLRGWLP